ncbi:MAG: glycosyltransferase family 2 protein [Cyclobacteriaceae bacterium]|nr:glycosyltransferase family 2 protein [Cyclobacteriaceae bacterium]
MSPGVSVIICAYNSVSKLEKTLWHLVNQKTNAELNWEVILVDNASTDNTALNAKKIWVEYQIPIPLSVIEEKKPGLSFARHAGITNSKYDFVLLCDDDNHLEENYVQQGFQLLIENKTVAALGGRGKIISDVVIPEWFERYKYNYACYSQGDDNVRIDKQVKSLYGAGLFIRKEIYQELFAQNFKHILSDRIGKKLISGGDTELTFAFRIKGYDLAYSSLLQFDHFMPANRLTERYLFELIKSQAYSAAQLRVYDFIFKNSSPTVLHWIKDCMYQTFFVAAACYRLVLNKDENNIDSIAGLQFCLGKLKGYFKQIGGYQKRYNQIYSVLIDSD